MSHVGLVRACRHKAKSVYSLQMGCILEMKLFQEVGAHLSGACG